MLKGLRAKTCERLLASRAADGPFSDHADLLRRVRPTPFELGALLRTGACDSLYALQATDYPWVHEALLAHFERGDSRALSRVVRQARARLPRGPSLLIERYRALSRVQNELRYLEMHVSAHPLRILRSEADRQGCVPSCRLAELVNQSVWFAGIVAATRSLPLTQAGALQFVTLEDEHGLVEARLSRAAHARLHAELTTPGPFLVRARVHDRQGALYLDIEQLLPFFQRGHGPQSALRRTGA
jgi:error-prone DNA polymerase